MWNLRTLGTMKTMMRRRKKRKKRTRTMKKKERLSTTTRVVVVNCGKVSEDDDGLLRSYERAENPRHAVEGRPTIPYSIGEY